ncbi:MAG TPA: hypothetical protein VKU84_13045 [Stellaceae bacterium]|nr:hypothetical protein [Stellaceae bacterium]
MAGLRFLDGVDRERSNRIDAKAIELIAARGRLGFGGGDHGVRAPRQRSIGALMELTWGSLPA